MSQIIYVNYQLLSDSRLHDILSQYNYNWSWYIQATKLYPGVGLNVRHGKNVLPFKNPWADHPIIQMPAYDPHFDQTFDDITDARTKNLQRTCSDRPWLIYWSGGIDSTVIVASILKNLSPADRQNVHIACNRVSIYEHPKFYYNHIKPNFHVVDLNHVTFNQPMLSKYYVIDGGFGDQIYEHLITKFWQSGNTTSIVKEWRKNTDNLIDFFSEIVDREFAEWYYELACDNINSVDVPIETIYDFQWWLSFNMTWTSCRWQPLTYITDRSAQIVRLCLKSWIRWYDTPEYQLWSMVSRQGVKYGPGIAEYKLASKKYIYDVDKDDYYFTFKTKTESVSRAPLISGQSYFCVLDDYTRLYLDDDLEQILNLLPGSINLKAMVA